MSSTGKGAISRGRARRAADTYANAADAIGPITADTNLFLVTRGQFSMIDMILHALDCLGPAGVSLWTWCVADYEVECFERLARDARITSARLIIDHGGEHRNGPLIQRWRDRFSPDAVRVCRNHAKIARVWTPDLRVLIRGSMNLNFNPRFEQADITTNGPDFDLIADIETTLPVLPPNPSFAAAAAASGVGLAWETKDLALFAGLKTWTP